MITMADRYQDRFFSADDDYGQGDDQHASSRGESDPLAELARLIGQTDPFGGMGRANLPVQPHGGERDRYDLPPASDEVPAATIVVGRERSVRISISHRDDATPSGKLPPPNL